MDLITQLRGLIGTCTNENLVEYLLAGSLLLLVVSSVFRLIYKLFD